MSTETKPMLYLKQPPSTIEQWREGVAEIDAHLTELRRERDNLRAFIENVIKCECWGRIDYLDGGSVQDEAERMGILVQVPHPLPCEVEICGCEGEDVDYLYQFKWHVPTLNTPTTDGNQ